MKKIKRMSDIASARIERLPPYLFGKINDIKLKKRQAGIDIIDLGMGNPDIGAPPHVVEELQESASKKKNHRYSASAGIFNLRRAVADRYRNHFDVTLSPEDEIITTIGSKEGISHMSLALLGPGDTALVPSPAFPIHIYSVVLAGGNVITFPLDSDLDQFLRSLHHLADTLYPKPKVLFLNFPHNPTTMVVEKPFLKEMVRFARTRGILIIHDFAYADIVYDGYVSPSILSIPGAKDVCVEFTTMSKTYGMAGFRVGFCAGNKYMIQALAKIKGYYDYGNFQSIQIASIVALRGDQDCVKKTVEIYQRRRDVLVEGLNKGGWKIEKPKATMFVWAPIPEEFRKISPMDLTLKLLEEAEVAVAPGIGFGEDGRYFLRIALVENENRIRQAIRQINRTLRNKPATK